MWHAGAQPKRAAGSSGQNYMTKTAHDMISNSRSVLKTGNDKCQTQTKHELNNAEPAPKIK